MIIMKWLVTILPESLKSGDDRLVNVTEPSWASLSRGQYLLHLVGGKSVINFFGFETYPEECERLLPYNAIWGSMPFATGSTCECEIKGQSVLTLPFAFQGHEK